LKQKWQWIDLVPQAYQKQITWMKNPVIHVFTQVWVLALEWQYTAWSCILTFLIVQVFRKRRFGQFEIRRDFYFFLVAPGVWQGVIVCILVSRSMILNELVDDVHSNSDFESAKHTLKTAWTIDDLNCENVGIISAVQAEQELEPAESCCQWCFVNFHDRVLLWSQPRSISSRIADTTVPLYSSRADYLVTFSWLWEVQEAEIRCNS